MLSSEHWNRGELVPNQIVKALEHAAEKLGRTLARDAGRAVSEFYRSTAVRLGKVSANIKKADLEHADRLKKITAHDGAASAHPRSAGGGGAPPGSSGRTRHQGEPQGRRLEPQPDWHGRSAKGMKGRKRDALDVSHLDPADQLAVLERESMQLAKDAVSAPPNAPGMTTGQHRLTQGCAGSFEHQGVITAHSSTTKQGQFRYPEAHPVLQEMLDGIKADADAGRIPRVGAGHGKCAEISLISDRLHQADPDGTSIRTPADARNLLQGGVMHTRQIGDMTDRSTGAVILPHGAYKPPCSTCTHLLPALGVHAHR
ncbi:YwqJ-related putative deaminase [Kitasatospora sp. NPDC088134]|uniref:YwqJ-related putative deaminase n=1 Tax=Kitasatospora sp. NPDC088134 TaxID=3364071 RepID=UPI003825A4F4